MPSYRHIALFFFIAVFPRATIASLPGWTLEIERLNVGDIHLSNITASNIHAAGELEAVQLDIASLSLEGVTEPYGPISLKCPGAIDEILKTMCGDGRWSAAFSDDWPSLTGSVIEASFDGGALLVRTLGEFDTLSWTAEVQKDNDRFELSLEIPEQSIESLQFFQPQVPALAWATAGTVRGSAQFVGQAERPAVAQAGFVVANVDFDSPDGLHAGLGIGARLSATLDNMAAGVIQVSGDLTTGELLLQDFYRDFSSEGLESRARLVLQQDLLAVERFSLSDGDALFLAGEARIASGPEAPPPELLLRELRLEFPGAYTRYLEPIAAVWTLDGLETAGSVRWQGDWSPGTARSGRLSLADLTLHDEKRGRFSIDSLDGTLATGSASRITWQAATFEKLDLGSGEASIALSEDTLSLLQPLRIGIFGGSLSLAELDLGFQSIEAPDIQLRAEIDGIRMEQMSSALGWPQFSGTLSGSIPGVNWSAGVIEIEGALDFRVFDGQVILTDLRVERPFGVLPSLAANITADNLDLQQLTQTFEFGRIAGRIDGYVHDLRMLDWRPVQFDAWFGTPEGVGRNDISRQAVRHLATLGGGNATATLTGPVLRLFNNFSYRRLGLGCVLRDNICQIRGIEEQGDGVLLLEGAGIPKISILAYNRAVDWPQLVVELGAVSGGEEVRVGN